jgi:hypothetical protein
VATWHPEQLADYGNKFKILQIITINGFAVNVTKTTWQQNRVPPSKSENPKIQ